MIFNSHLGKLYGKQVWPAEKFYKVVLHDSVSYIVQDRNTSHEHSIQWTYMYLSLILLREFHGHSHYIS